MSAGKPFYIKGQKKGSWVLLKIKSKFKVSRKAVYVCLYKIFHKTDEIIPGITVEKRKKKHLGLLHLIATFEYNTVYSTSWYFSFISTDLNVIILLLWFYVICP